MKKIELLAPAGNYESLLAAINAGADAVYLGGTKFGARANADNFNNDSLEKAINYSHIMGVKVYVTVNTLIKDEEIEEFIEYIDLLYYIGADALIMQDIGMINLVKQRYVDFEVHASTQMTVNSSEDIRFLKELGVSRVVLSRELTYDEIINIKKNTDVTLEAFVHGALCVSYSGKCLLSSMYGGRSSNRGICAQPCRQKYDIKCDNEIIENKNYLFSTKDLKTLDILDKLIDSGIYSFKIEGRMKRSEYVYKVTRIYRMAIDKILKTQNDNLPLSELNYYNDELKKVFNRDFTKGYIGNHIGSDIMNHDFQNYKGSLVAKVIRFDKKNNKLILLLEDTLNKGDGLNTGEFVGRIINSKNEIVESAEKGEIISIDSIKSFEENYLVYKTHDKKNMNIINEGISKNKKCPIKIVSLFKKNEFPLLTIYDDDGIKVSYIYESITENAINKATTIDIIEKQFNKMGDTNYFVTDIQINLDDNLFIPLKTLNYMRREAISNFEIKKIESFKRKKTNTNFSILKNNYSERKHEEILLSFEINNYQQMQAISKFNINRIYTQNFDLYKKLIVDFNDKNIYFSLPSVLRESDLRYISELINNMDNMKIMHSTLGFINKEFINNTILDYPINLLNSYSHNLINSKGIDSTFSPEMLFSLGGDLKYLNELNKIEIPIYVYPKLMISEFCPYKNETGKCIYKKCILNDTIITNENKEEFLIKRTINCKTILHSKEPNRLYKDDINRLLKKGYYKFRIEFINETYEQVIDTINYFL